MKFTCASCWQVNETTADPSQGSDQTYVEDCRVCCRPMVLTIRIVDGEATADAVSESD